MRDWLLALALLVATALAYQAVIHAGFVWDDDVMLNRAVQAPDGLKAIWCSTELPDYFPVTSTVLWLEWRLWGGDPLGYHVVNVLLHAIGAVLLWRVLRRLKVAGAWFAAAAFALHPVNVESVAWVTEHKNTLAMVFFALTLLLYARSEEDNRPKWYVGSLAAFVLALLSKTAVAPLPVVLLALAWWRRGRVTRADFRRVLPFFAAAAVLALVTIWFQAHRAIGPGIVRQDGLLGRCAVAGAAIWFYFYHAWLPLDLAFIYPRWQLDPTRLLAYVPLGAAAIALWACWRWRERWGRAPLFALACFVALLLPVLGFLDISFMRHSLVADRWQYFAVVPAVALVVGAVARVTNAFDARRRILVQAAAAAVLVALGAATWQRSRIFENPSTLWHATLARNPSCAAAHDEIGIVLASRGDLDGAIAEYQQALAAMPDYELAHYNLGCALAQKGDTAGAVAHYRAAIAAYPTFADARYNLGTVLLETGHANEAVAEFRAALADQPDSAKFHNNLATAYWQLGRRDDAIRTYERALQLQPNHAKAHFNLGTLLFQAGQPDLGLSHLQTAVRLDPADADAHKSLADVYLARQEFEAAIGEYRKASALHLDSPELSNNFGYALLLSGKPADAVSPLEHAVALAPNSADIRNNLANALLNARQLDAAIAQYEASLNLEPNNAKAHNNIGWALYQAGRLDDAATHFARAVQLQPDYANARNNYGELLLARGDNAAALAQLRQAVEQQPGFADAHYHLALALVRTGRAAEAAQQFAAALAGEPNNAHTLADFAVLLATSGDPAVRNVAQARELAARAATAEGAADATVRSALAAVEAALAAVAKSDRPTPEEPPVAPLAN